LIRNMDFSRLSGWSITGFQLIMDRFQKPVNRPGVYFPPRGPVDRAGRIDKVGDVPRVCRTDWPGIPWRGLRSPDGALGGVEGEPRGWTVRHVVPRRVETHPGDRTARRDRRVPRFV